MTGYLIGFLIGGYLVAGISLSAGMNQMIGLSTMGRIAAALLWPLVIVSMVLLACKESFNGRYEP